MYSYITDIKLFGGIFCYCLPALMDRMFVVNLLHVVNECQLPEAAPVLYMSLWCIVVYFIKPGTELHGIAFL